jgi:hypothetical protein
VGKSLPADFYDYNFRSVRRNQFGDLWVVVINSEKLPDFILFGKTRLTHVMQGTLSNLVYSVITVRIAYYGKRTIFEVGRQNVFLALR